MLNREIVFAQQKTIDGDIKCVLKCSCWLFCKAQNGLFFIYLCMAEMGLHCCSGLFSSCGVRASHCVPSLVEEHGLWSTGSVAAGHRLSCSVAYGIFPDHVSNLCLLHWLTDSLPLNHQGSPDSV